MTHLDDGQDAGTRDRTWRRGGIVVLALLLPAMLLAWLGALSSEEYSRCITHGDCAGYTDTAESVAWYAFWGSVLSGAVGVIAPASRPWGRSARPGLVVLQVSLQAVAFLAVLSLASPEHRHGARARAQKLRAKSGIDYPMCCESATGFSRWVDRPSCRPEPGRAAAVSRCSA